MESSSGEAKTCHFFVCDDSVYLRWWDASRRQLRVVTREEQQRNSTVTLYCRRSLKAAATLLSLKQNRELSFSSTVDHQDLGVGSTVWQSDIRVESGRDAYSVHRVLFCGDDWAVQRGAYSVSVCFGHRCFFAERHVAVISYFEVYIKSVLCTLASKLL